MEPIVEVTVNSTYEDYKAYYWLWYRRENRAHQLYYILLALITLVGYVLAAQHSLSLRFTVAKSALIFWPIALILLAIRPRQAYRHCRETCEAAKSYAFFEDYLFIQWSDRGADTQVTAQYSRYTWAAESYTAFYLKTPDRNYMSLPKHCFTEDQTAALRALFARKFGDRFKTKL